MKKVLLLVLLSLTLPRFSASAQMTNAELDSLEYIIPHFSIGTVVFFNEDRTQAMLNINAFDNAIRFIEGGKDTLVVKNEETVKAVYVQNRYFTKWGNLYVEILNPMNDTSLGITRKIDLIQKKSVGAYGMASETASVSSLSHAYDGMGGTFKLKSGGSKNFYYKENYYICKGNKKLPASKKNFLKVYPKLKGDIEVYLKENKVDYTDINDLKALYDFCIKKSR